MQIKRLTGMFLFAMASVSSALLTAQTPEQARPAKIVPSRVLSVVDLNDRVALSRIARPWTTKATDLGAVAGQTPAPRMILLLQRSAQQQQALNEYVSDLQNASSPRYHHWLTPGQYADTYGINAEDVAAVTAWLQSQGFVLDKVAPARNAIEFSGSVAQLQQAFGTQVHRLTLGDRSEITSVSSIQVPRALSPVIRGLVNLDSSHPRKLIQTGPSARYDSSTHKFKPQFTVYDNGTPLLFVDPADAALIYDTPNANLNPNFHGATLDGTGVNVGIIGDSNVDLTPVENYRQAFLGETAGNQNLPTIIIDGSDPGETGDVVESWLDMEILGGIAPSAKLYYYASADGDITGGVQNAILRAVNDNLVSILSISFGGCEADQGTAGNAFFSEIYEQAAAQGITVTVSTGDSGSAGCDADYLPTASQGLAVNGLASTPYNIAVGGTDFDVLGTDFETYVDDSISGNPPYYLTALSYIPEEPWNNSTQANGALADNLPLASGSGPTNIIGGGGGTSGIYSKPAFQTGLTPQDGARDLPDVSFFAANGLYGASWAYCEIAEGSTDCATANGQLTDTATIHGAGGTSASTPAFAGMLALLVQSTGSRLGQANNVLYRLAATNAATLLHDVAAGNNSVVCSQGSTDCGSNGFLNGWDTGTGYDKATGLGSLDAAQMVSLWPSAALAPTATTFNINGSAAGVSVTHGTSLNLQVGVNPASATGDVALVANTSSLSGLATIPLTGGTGASSFNGLPGGQYTVYARYGGDGSDAASSSSPILVNVGKEDSSIALSANGYDPSTGAPLGASTALPYGSLILIDATVYGTAEGLAATQGIATGNITFTDNGAALATAAISSAGSASYPSLQQFVPVTGGTHKIVASYPGDTSYNATTSAAVTFTVTKATEPMTVLPASGTVSNVGYDYITVELPGAGAGAFETGPVTLTANGVTLATGNLATVSTSTGQTYAGVTVIVAGNLLQSGVNTITATYPGDANYNAATMTFPLIVSQASFSLSSSAISTIAGSNGTAVVRAIPLSQFTGLVDLTCTVTSAPANAASPVTCSIPPTINLGGLNSVTTTLTAQTTAATTSGSYGITVTGTDEATKKLTASATSTVTVSGAIIPPSIALANTGPVTVTAGATSNNTSTLTLSSTGGFTGTAGLACAVTSSPAGANDPITCSLSSPSAALTGNSPYTALVYINSTASTTTTALKRGVETGGAMLAILLIFIPARRRRLVSMVCVLALAFVAGSISGCSSGGSTNTGGGGTTPPKTVPGTTAGAYVVQVTATATGVTAVTSTVNVTVN